MNNKKDKFNFIKENMNIIEYERYDKQKDIIHKKNSLFKIGSWKKYQLEKYPINNNSLDENKNHSLICGNYENKKFPYNIGVIDIDVESKNAIKRKDINKFLNESKIEPFEILRTPSNGVHIVFITDINDENNNNKIKSGVRRSLNIQKYPKLKNLNIKNIDICGQGRLSFYYPTEFVDKNELLGKYTLIYQTDEPKINNLKKINKLIDKNNPNNLFILQSRK